MVFTKFFKTLYFFLLDAIIIPNLRRQFIFGPKIWMKIQGLQIREIIVISGKLFPLQFSKDNCYYKDDTYRSQYFTWSQVLLF